MKLNVTHKSGSYDILLERGALSRLSQYANLERKVLVVTDEGVPSAYLEQVLAQCPQGYSLVVSQGEGSKSFPVLESICQKLLQEAFSRSDLIIALGGGVVGDLAGFAAACYMRGIDFINIPTTSLSQIDSGIGGKTAINLDGVKNSIGAFYQPKLVLADPDTLKTLPPRHFANGMVEAVKAGLIGDRELFELFEREDPQANADEIIYRSLCVKKRVVEEDEQEKGLRKILNFGHTIGHGVESVYGLSGLLHGEAVAVGILPMLGGNALRDRVRAVFQKLQINPDMPFDSQKVYEVMTRDKKTHGGRITIVKVDVPGEAYLEDIPIEELLYYLQ